MSLHPDVEKKIAAVTASLTEMRVLSADELVAVSNDFSHIARLAAEKEREACARTCEWLGGINIGPPTDVELAREECATAIRRRGKP